MMDLIIKELIKELKVVSARIDRFLICGLGQVMQNVLRRYSRMLS
jgi:hypothetical protein